MDIKEKAKELFDMFYSIEPVEPIYIGMDKGQAKQCALICVDEILKADPLSPSKFNTKLSKGEAYKESEGVAYTYWGAVKKEINKL